MNKSSSEKHEYVVGAIGGGLILALVDGILILADTGKVHEFFQGLLLITAVVTSITLAIRWFRQHDEMLDALELSQHLFQETESAKQLKEIIIDYTEISNKKWPDFTQSFLSKSLQEFTENKIYPLKIGTIDCDLDFGRMHSPKFFTIWDGPCFVTAYGSWSYWNSIAGQEQLRENRKVIDPKKNPRKTITRYFILRDCEDLPEDRIIQDQIDAKIKVMVVHENSVDEKYRCDIGVFFDGGNEIVFLSKWELNKMSARLVLDGKELHFGRKIYDNFLANGTAQPIAHLDDWNRYKTTFAK